MPTEIRAAVFHEVGKPLEVEMLTLDDPAPDEVRVSVVGSGLCHTDLHIFEGHMPLPPPVVAGHEAAGIIVEVGTEVRGLQVGDHVINSVSTHCDNCYRCARGETWLCERGIYPGIRTEGRPKLRAGTTPVEGVAGMHGFSEQMLTHHSAAVPIDPDMPLDRAALIGCGVVTGVGTVINAARMRPGETCVVIGCGGIGLNVVQGARLAGAGRIIAVDVQPSKLDLAGRFGATDLVNPGDGDAVEAVLALTGGRGVDHAFEAIGLVPTSEQALAMTATGGGCYLIGVVPAGVAIEVQGLDFVSEDKTLRGVRMGASNIDTDFPRFVELYQQGRLLLDELVAEHITLEQINEGYERMKTGEHARSVVMFDPPA
jgi:S-(hydroxymethyl)glutathione dehydrogenase/alcohol dehydrogenase